jgi:hypothetical protein
MEEARAVLATLAPTDRFHRRRVFLAVLAWLTQEDRA